MLKKILILIFFFLFGLLFVYSKDIKQINGEYLFLTSHGIEELEIFKEKNPEINSLIIYSKELEHLNFVNKDLLEVCKDRCEIINKNDHALIVMTSQEEVSVLKEIIEKLHDDEKLNLLGHSYTNALLDDYSKVIQDKIFPLMFLSSFVILLLLTKKLINSLILFFPCILGALLSLSSLKFIFGSMNMVTSIVPLMSFVVSLCLTQHLYFSLSPKESFGMKEVLRYKTKPILLMVSTTFIGFSSLYLSSIEVIRNFGILSAILIVVCSLIVMSWLLLTSTYLSITSSPIISAIKFYPKKTLSKKIIYSISIILCLISAVIFKKVPIITDATEYFPKSSKLKEKMLVASKLVGGVPILEIAIKFKEDIEFLDLLELVKMEDELLKIDQLDIISNNKTVKEVNQIYANSSELPGNYNAYLALRSKAPEAFKDAYSVGENQYHLTILGEAMNVDKYELLLSKVSKILKDHKYEFEFNGLYYNLMISQKEMVYTLLKSFVSSLIIIIAIAYLALKKTKIILSFLIVNSLPVLFSIIFIYVFEMSLNIATIMTYSIALGMVVDSSFHMIHALEDRKQSFNSFKMNTIIPILTSSVILIISFGLFMFEEFSPIKEFGMNLSFIIFIGLIFDIFVLPTLYLNSHKISENFYESNS